MATLMQRSDSVNREGVGGLRIGHDPATLCCCKKGESVCVLEVYVGRRRGGGGGCR